MSVEATAAVWARRDLTATEKLVAVRLADHASPDGTDAWPAVKRLCADTGLSERAVQGALQRLVEKGALRLTGKHRRHHTNVYAVDLTPAPTAPPQQVLPAADAPPQDVRPTPADAAPTPRTSCTPTPAAGAPKPSVNHPGTSMEPSLPSSKLDRRSPLAVVFGSWQEATGKRRAVLDGKRTRLINAALKQYPLDDIVDAVRGWQNVPHNRGENDRSTVYNDLELLLRDAQHIERFRDAWRDPSSVVVASRQTSAPTGRSLTAIDKARLK